MTPITIKGATRHLLPRQGWKDTPDRACVGLHVRVTGDTYQSAWQPSAEDLEILNGGGSILLWVVGGQPPVSLSVEAAADHAGAWVSVFDFKGAVGTDVLLWWHGKDGVVSLDTALLDDEGDIIWADVGGTVSDYTHVKLATPDTLPPRAGMDGLDPERRWIPIGDFSGIPNIDQMAFWANDVRWDRPMEMDTLFTDSEGFIEGKDNCGIQDSTHVLVVEPGDCPAPPTAEELKAAKKGYGPWNPNYAINYNSLLEEHMEVRGWSIVDLARALSCTDDEAIALSHGCLVLDQAWADRLQAVFGVHSEIWLGIQGMHQAWWAAKQEEDRIALLPWMDASTAPRDGTAILGLKDLNADSYEWIVVWWSKYDS